MHVLYTSIFEWLEVAKPYLNDIVDIPKDFLVKSASLETVSAADKAAASGDDPAGKFASDASFAEGDKYLDFVINTVADGDGDTESDQHIYINVSDLIDIYTAGNGLQESSGAFSIKLDSSFLNGLKVGANGLGLDLAAGASTTYVAATGTYVDGTTYYTSNTGATTVDTTGFEDGVTDVSSYFVAQAVAAKNGAMSGTDKGKLDGISN